MASYQVVVLELITKDVWAEVWLNGTPALRFPTGEQVRIQQKANPWIVEGPNWIQARLGYPREQDGLGPKPTYEFRVFEVEWGNPDGERKILAIFDWDPEGHPIEEPGLRMVYEQQFSPEQTHGRWSWEDATPYQDGDRPKIESLAGDLHQAFARQDVPTITGMMTTKLSELGRGLDLPAAEMTQNTGEALEAGFEQDDWVLGPFDPAELVVEPTAGGKLVNVFGPDGGPPVRATMSGEVVEVGMTVSHLAQGWTIVR